MIRTGRRIAPGDVWGHNLVELADMLAPKVAPLPAMFQEKLKVFNDYFNELRYPQGLSNVKGLGKSEALWLDRLAEVVRKHASAS